MTEKPKVSSQSAQREIDKVEKHFDQFKEEVESLTLDRMNEAPKEAPPEQPRLSAREEGKLDILFIKPKRTISSKEKFNENFRKDYNFSAERVNFKAENNEIIGETIEMWTKPYPGLPAEYWEIPVNRPVNAPRYVAEQIRKCTYHRLVMQDRPVSTDSTGVYYGTMVADTTKQRLDAHPVSERKSIFMGAGNF